MVIVYGSSVTVLLCYCIIKIIFLAASIFFLSFHIWERLIVLVVAQLNFGQKHIFSNILVEVTCHKPPYITAFLDTS